MANGTGRCFDGDLTGAWRDDLDVLDGQGRAKLTTYGCFHETTPFLHIKTADTLRRLVQMRLQNDSLAMCLRNRSPVAVCTVIMCVFVYAVNFDLRAIC